MASKHIMPKHLPRLASSCSPAATFSRRDVRRRSVLGTSLQRPRSVRVSAHSTSQQGKMHELNKISSHAVRVMVAVDKSQVWELVEQLDDMRVEMISAGDRDGACFVSVLQSLLDHTVPPQAAELQGPYLQAFNRICNAVQGSEWKLTEAGKSADLPDDGLKFSTWEDVVNSKKQRRGEGGGVQGAGPVDTHYYDVLRVAPSASQDEIKSSYRKLALQLHPDVNSAADANQQFAAISAAYDVLSDPVSRSLYDKHGADGMKGYSGAESGSGNSERFWSEFKPYKRENKHTRARSAASHRSVNDEGVVSSDGTSTAGKDVALQPQAGDVVEYPLSEVVKAETQDYSRSHGVGLLVSRNMDRGDARNLPPELLQLCEIEPLRQEEPESHRWVADELLPCAFNNLQDLKTVPVDEYDPRFDVWTITVPLSEGCAGPPMPEEVML